MNELSKETSPYLLQHASNPVHWKAWNAAALDKAKREDKLIIVSSGYSACHWCHVMEHESFENDEVAGVMNKNFISIKVDREERPDIDAIYMKAVQIMTGQGGWPMNVICLPDGRPVWGGTYFPKNNWVNSLEQLSEMYRTDRNRMVEYAEKLHQGLDAISIMAAEQPHDDLSQDLLLPLIEKWTKSFDKDFGGYARAPKFMMPTNWKFLQRYGFQNNDESVLKQVDLTFTKMAYGGLFDTVGGGFSRYSVDMEWHVPHFEKMLYDNGQLVSLYADAFKRTKNGLYKEVIEKTIDFVNRELSNSEGGFYSALDADSLNFQGELEEGAFYVWTKPELQNLIGDDYDLFAEVFNVNEFGHWEHDNYVLIQTDSLESIAEKHNINADKLSAKKQSWEKTLFDAREKRPKPRLDDKCLTSWNAIMGKGLCNAFEAIGDQQYIDAAVKNARFLTEKLWLDGQLFRNYKNGKASINGYLEDYAHTIDFLVALYQVTFDEQWLRDAKQMTDYCFAHFYDENSGFFRFTSDEDTALVAAHFETEDNVIPASNSVMAANLYRLSVYFSNPHYESVCEHMLKYILPIIDYPSAFSNWLDVLMNFSEKQRELAICGNDAIKFARKLIKDYRPNITIAATETVSSLPFLESRFVENTTLFYVCHNKTCGLPLDNLDAVMKDL
jgi:uncharacterized protein YyaL (SSP411 family)